MHVRRFAVSAVLAASLWGVASAAAAQSYPGGEVPPQPPGGVLGAEESRGDVKPQAQVRGVQFAVTGGDVVGLTVLGAGLVGGGAILVRRTRRPAAQPST